MLLKYSVDLGDLFATFLELLGVTYFVVALLKWKDRPRPNVDDFYAHLTPEQRASADELGAGLTPQARRRLDELILKSCCLCAEPLGHEPTVSADGSGNFMVHRRCLAIYDQLRARHFPDNKT